MRPLEVVATLRGAVALPNGPLALDGLLAAAVAMEQGIYNAPLLDGSARLALKAQPQFDRYIFIDRDAKRCSELEALKVEFPNLAANIRVEQGEANAEIQKICAKDWSAHRAVLFLDPYGMQVEWQTIEAIAKTKAIDLWLLFPLGIGVSRLLTRSGEIPKGWRTRLDKLLANLVGEEHALRVRRAQGEKRGVDLVRVEVDARIADRARDGVHAVVARKAKAVRPVLGVERRRHFDSPSREAAFWSSIHWSRSARLNRHWPPTLKAGSWPFWAIE